ncbi:MAG TPA: glycerol-3-phosphate 1-O-acyltransferase PlsY [Aggregatilinea sp.]|jgi:glycerol-3-phosphate acyltransferase PlsY|uniref:glycerol-3-phosphate 1-O-acyltransferase PlsY n=1 Tax=Aggregatilinea sp. TaxID=2806333 RepID=UPI002C819AD0|nr:glycerol-3-phosphate 1-O-acyltransferase PlsY [Aggregatilinea sp.]HML24570.1 glycerol-3-phosphate 1-O-acyltransferase PlsY [Aggregatilinea sp.]
MDLVIIVAIIVVGYLIGSFPTAYIVGKVKGVDIFKVGSGNMGATNVARACGIQYGALVWLWDGLKGVLAVLLARAVMPDNTAAASVLAAVAVVAGHNWSFLATIITGSIKGGKGAATASGTFLLLAPTFLVVIVLAVAAAVVLLTRYVSLAVLTSVAAAAVAILVLIGLNVLEPVYSLYLFVAWMIFIRHRSNIYNLLAGKERRLGDRV